MSIVKTSELIGAALDWAVAECEIASGNLTRDENDHGVPLLSCGHVFHSHGTGVTEIGKAQGRPEFVRGCASGRWCPSADWSQGGPIIERELNNLFKQNKLNPSEPDVWVGVKHVRGAHGTNLLNIAGHTPLVAAMRCYVASKLGDEVEVPDVLVGVSHG